MRPVLRRIAIHGGLTAIVLGIVGMMFAEMATLWMSASLAPRSRSASNENAPDPSVLRTRLPLMMAGIGLGFVAAGELMLHFLRMNRTLTLLPSPPAPDSTEKLLEELLAQAEARSTPAQETVAPTTCKPENTLEPSLHKNLLNSEK